MQGYNEIIADLKKAIYRPVYFLSGEEPYYIDMISDYIEENVLQDMEKEFNQCVLYGRDVSANDIISNCRRFPMMSNYQVIIVKEAQDIKDIENLASYVESPLDSTILVVCYKYKKVDKRKSFAKLLEKKAVLFESARVYDNQIQPWIVSFAQQLGYSIDAKASFLMAEFLGNDLSKIVNEVNKLIINIPKGSTITSELVEKNIGISKDFNVFELQKALGTKNILKANQIIKYFSENEKENPLVKVLPILYAYFVKVFMLHNIEDKSPNNLAAKLSVSRMFIDDYSTASRNYPQEKLVRIFRLLKNYDLKCKGIDNAASDGDLMKELIYKIIH